VHLRRATFDFGKLIAFPPNHAITSAPFTAPMLSETQKPLVTCCVPVQVHIAVVWLSFVRLLCLFVRLFVCLFFFFGFSFEFFFWIWFRFQFWN
jgi:hypothetical protein